MFQPEDTTVIVQHKGRFDLMWVALQIIWKRVSSALYPRQGPAYAAQPSLLHSHPLQGEGLTEHPSRQGGSRAPQRPARCPQALLSRSLQHTHVSPDPSRSLRVPEASRTSKASKFELSGKPVVHRHAVLIPKWPSTYVLSID